VFRGVLAGIGHRRKRQPIEEQMSTYRVRIAGLVRELPIVSVSPDTNIAFLKLYGDRELVRAAAKALADEIRPEIDVLVGPETGGILLAHLLAEHADLPYVVARKKVRPHMRRPSRVTVRTIGTAGAQELVLGEDDAGVLSGRRAALVDEVVSSGGTIRALTALTRAAGATVDQILAVATEGAPRDEVTALCHLPLFPGERPR
jgi:adenine phosphoribosyltransferase